MKKKNPQRSGRIILCARTQLHKFSHIKTFFSYFYDFNSVNSKFKQKQNKPFLRKIETKKFGPSLKMFKASTLRIFSCFDPTRLCNLMVYTCVTNFIKIQSKFIKIQNRHFNLLNNVKNERIE